MQTTNLSRTDTYSIFSYADIDAVFPCQDNLIASFSLLLRDSLHKVLRKAINTIDPPTTPYKPKSLFSAANDSPSAFSFFSALHHAPANKTIDSTKCYETVSLYNMNTPSEYIVLRLASTLACLFSASNLSICVMS